MAIVRLFAAAREAAGTGRDELPGGTVADVLTAARERYGAAFTEVLGSCRIWLNGDAAELDAAVGAADEVAVLPPVSGGSDGPVGLEELRSRRRELQERDDAISYVRRVAQARGDLARAAMARRRGEAPAVDRDEELRTVLADRLLAGPGRPPRPIEDFSDDPRSTELDQLCADHGFGRLDELDAPALDTLVGAVEDFEARISAERHEVFAELDALTEQLVERYHDQYGVDPASDS